MEWNDDRSVGDLQRAFKESRFADADALVDALVDSLHRRPRKVEAGVAKKVLACLRSYARFPHLFRVAGLLLENGQTSPEVRRLLAQAYIEQGQITSAIELLTKLQAELEEQRGQAKLEATTAESIEFELGEALGLLGRAYKQLYIDAHPRPVEPRSDDLERALDYYGRAFRERLGDYKWHGVNHVALLTHAERVKTGQPNVTSPAAEREAAALLEAIEDLENRGPLQPWDAANRAEALLAMGKNPQAIEAVQRYLETPGLDAFAVQSTRRQLQQIWLLRKDTYPGSEILPMMTARFAELGGGLEGVDLTAVDGKALEKIWGDTGYQPIQWLRDALERARCVARLGPSVYEGWGTGFLLDGAWIDASWKDRRLLLTNAHVCTADPEVQKQYPYPPGPADNKAVFMELGEPAASPVAVDVLEQIWTSPPSKLDATLLEIAEPPPRAICAPALGAPPDPKVEGARVNILGHPQGLALRISLQDNRLVSVDDTFLHYRTPTDPGSSGSPIFDQDWRLVGLHHSSSATKKANEGIRLDRILEAIRAAVLSG